MSEPGSPAAAAEHKEEETTDEAKDQPEASPQESGQEPAGTSAAAMDTSGEQTEEKPAAAVEEEGKEEEDGAGEAEGGGEKEGSADQVVQEEEKEKGEGAEGGGGGEGGEEGREKQPEGAAAPPPQRKRLWSTDPAQGVDLAVASGSGLEAAKPSTVGKMFQETVSKVPDHPALKYKQEGQWVAISYKEYYQLSVNAAKSFLKLGLEPYHGVAIIGFNAAEWLISNNAAIFAGGLAAGVYTTNNPEACHYIAEDCKANVIVVENQKQLDKILQIRDKLPHLKAIVQYKGKLSQEYENVYDWEQFMELGKDMESSEIEQRIAEQKPEQCALLVYTSGTTGNPKGVMLSHDNLTWTANSLAATYGEMVFATERSISYLPLSHIAAQMADIYLPILCGATVHFAQPDALKGTLVDTLREVLPTFFFGVPRVYEKMMERMQDSTAAVSSFKRRVVKWAMNKGIKGNENLQKNEPMPWAWTVANKLLFKKVRNLLGFQHCRLFVAGGAPISVETLRYFMSVNVPIMDLYGMSECSGPETINLVRGERWRVGTSGKPLVGCQLKIQDPDENQDGEILFYGRHVFMGYLNNEEKTKEAIDEDGWLHSGDIGKIDKDGFLKITGRIKELIITSGGENVAPVFIEDNIKRELPFLSNVMVIGDKRKYLTCLMTIKCVMDLDSGEPTDKLSPQAQQMLEALGCSYSSVSEVIEKEDPKLFSAIQAGLDQANLHAISHAQKVQKWSLLDTDFSVPGGELGPTLKLRRRIVVQKYGATIDAMYE